MTQTYLVAAWRGTNNGYRNLGSGLSESAAIRRIDLASRIWPDMARARAYALELGNTDVLAMVRTYQ
jgi:hypothetical protein